MVPGYRLALRLFQTVGVCGITRDVEVRPPGSRPWEFWSFATLATRFLSDPSLPCDCSACNDVVPDGFEPPDDVTFLLRVGSSLLWLDDSVVGSRLESLLNLLCEAYRAFLAADDLDDSPYDRCSQETLDALVAHERRLMRAAIDWLREGRYALARVSWDPGRDAAFAFATPGCEACFVVCSLDQAAAVRDQLTGGVQ